jgi:large subunit ribosomal protein L21e
MTNKKPVRTRGKLKLSRYFQKFNEGDFAAISREPAVQSSFPTRFQGITGIIEGRKGKTYILKIKDGNKEKRLLIEPIHLKKIKQVNK